MLSRWRHCPPQTSDLLLYRLKVVVPRRVWGQRVSAGGSSQSPKKERRKLTKRRREKKRRRRRKKKEKEAIQMEAPTILFCSVLLSQALGGRHVSPVPAKKKTNAFHRPLLHVHIHRGKGKSDQLALANRHQSSEPSSTYPIQRAKYLPIYDSL